MPERHVASFERSKPTPAAPVERTPCEAVGPDGRVCTKTKTPSSYSGKNRHGNTKHHVRGTPSSELWDGGRDGMQAKWREATVYQHPGDMSEGEWQAYGRFGY